MNRTLRRPFELAGLASRVAAARIRPAGPGRVAAVERVVAHLGRLHGLPQKIGQILASAELGADSRRFAPLTGDPQFALPATEARTLAELRLGRPLESLFARFDARGIAASFGQVHRATLHDGREVAVKLSYPAVEQTLQADLRALGWLAAPLGNLRRDFDLAAYRRELGQRLAGELDYVAEAATLRRFVRRTSDWPTAIVPAPLDEFCGEGVLVMPWIDGTDLDAAARWPHAARAQLARTLLDFFLTGLFAWRELHADPHPGNFRYLPATTRTGARVAWLDFGSTHAVPEEFATALRDLIAAHRHGALDAGAAWSFHEHAGFDLVPLTPLREQLPSVLAALLRPFAQPGEFDAAGWHPGDELSPLLGERRLAYRVAGPPALLFFIRTFHGLLTQLRTLAVPLDWNAALDEVLHDHGLAPETTEHSPRFTCRNAEAEASAFQPRPFTATLENSVSPAIAAGTLCVEVMRGADSRVCLQFHGEAAANLPELVPADLLPAIHARGIDLSSLARQAEHTAFAPQELFSLHEGERRIRVWLR